MSGFLLGFVGPSRPSMQVWSRPALHRLAHPAGPAVCGGILFQPDKTGKRTERRFPPDHLKVMGVHRRLSYETVGYASDYITQGSLPRDSDDGISSCTMREYFCGGKQTLLCVFFSLLPISTSECSTQYGYRGRNHSLSAACASAVKRERRVFVIGRFSIHASRRPRRVPCRAVSLRC